MQWASSDLSCRHVLKSSSCHRSIIIRTACICQEYRIRIFLTVQLALLFSRVLEVLVWSLAPSENVCSLMTELLCWNIGHVLWSTISQFQQRKWIVSINSVILYLWQIITCIQVWISLSSKDTSPVILHTPTAQQISTLGHVKKQNFKNYIFSWRGIFWYSIANENCSTCTNHVPFVTHNTWLSKCLTFHCWSDDGHMG